MSVSCNANLLWKGVFSRAEILKGLLDTSPYRQHTTADKTQSPDFQTASNSRKLKTNIHYLSSHRLSWSTDRRDLKSISTVIKLGDNIDIHRICTIHQSDQCKLSQKKYVVEKKQVQQRWDLPKWNMEKQKLKITIANALSIQGLNRWACLSFKAIPPADCIVAVLTKNGKELPQDLMNAPQMVDRTDNDRAVRYESMYAQTECRLRDMQQVKANQTGTRLESKSHQNSSTVQHAPNDHDIPSVINEQNMEPSDVKEQHIGYTEHERAMKGISIEDLDLSRITAEYESVSSLDQKQNLALL